MEAYVQVIAAQGRSSSAIGVLHEALHVLAELPANGDVTAGQRACRADRGAVSACSDFCCNPCYTAAYLPRVAVRNACWVCFRRSRGLDDPHRGRETWPGDP